MSSGLDFMAKPAIDVHGHCGEYLGYPPHGAELYNAPPAETSQRARDCAITVTVVSELGAFDVDGNTPSDVDAANARAVEGVEQHDNLLFWAVVNPRLDGWEPKTDRLLGHPRCAGVKLHPRWNFWPVEDARYSDRLFAFLHERNTLTLTHTGDAGNEPRTFVPWADKYANLTMILAHIGHDWTGRSFDNQTEAVRMSEHGNLWADTSSRASVFGKIIERSVSRIGADRILFGTDTPLYFAAMQKARVAYADISDADKQKILYDNAASLLRSAVGDCILDDAERVAVT